MPAQIRSLSDFLRRLSLEGSDTPFTWLIGAGMSWSAGIPLARDVSARIAIFEYLAQEQRPRPWDENNEHSISYKNDLSHFLNWYQHAEVHDNSRIQEIGDASSAWLSKQKDFENFSLSNPETYSQLFKVFFQSTTLHHKVLTLLVGKARGINLSHLGLAGLLR
ncbi:MAG: hypothetical protein AAF772_20920, partial [Acidobacteriota bacterium]